MLWWERQVVDALMDPELDAAARDGVRRYVATTLRDMPEHLRLGVAAESIAFGSLGLLQRSLGRLDDDQLRHRVESMRSSRVDLIRQYVRLLQSLVLFAENERAPVA